jgi:hypothetical protein
MVEVLDLLRVHPKPKPHHIGSLLGVAKMKQRSVTRLLGQCMNSELRNSW